MDFLTAPRGELLKLIYELIDENKALRIQIAELKAHKDTGDPQNQKQLPAFVKASVKKKRHTKRKNREHGFGRVKDTPSNQVFHAYDVCPSCGGILGKPSVAYTRQVIDIPVPHKEVVEHVVCKRWCFSCGKRVHPKLKLAGLVVGKKRIGSNTMALVDFLREQLLVPLNKIQQYFFLLYNLHLSEGALVSMLHQTADMGKPDYEQIKKKIRQSNVLYADETGGRENGINGYHWGFMNKRYQFLLYRKSRGSMVVKEVLGADDEKDAFTGTLVTDFYASYNEYQGFHQRCSVHLLRDMKELHKKYPNDRHLTRWTENTHAIFAQAKAYPGPDPALPIGLQAQERIDKENYFKQKLRTISEPYVTKDVPQSTLCSRIMKYLPELFTFIRSPDVEPDNNRAERGLRHLVLARKISGGTRSKRGSETRSILGSLFGTWRLQGLNPLEQTRLLLLRSP